jgi:hypothetical protein
MWRVEVSGCLESPKKEPFKSMQFSEPEAEPESKSKSESESESEPEAEAEAEAEQESELEPNPPFLTSPRMQVGIVRLSEGRSVSKARPGDIRVSQLVKAISN